MTPDTAPQDVHYRRANARPDDYAAWNVGACGRNDAGIVVTTDPHAVTCSVCVAREARHDIDTEALVSTLTPVVAALPSDDGVWALVRDTGAGSGVRLVRDDGVTVWVRRETYGSNVGKLTLSGGVPDGANYSAGDYGRSDDTRPAITVTPTRPAATLARDIARRLLPQAAAYWHAVHDRMTARLSTADRARTLATEIDPGAWVTHPERAHRWRFNLPGEYPGVTASGETSDGVTTDVEIRRMTPDQTRELAALVSSWQQTTQPNGV